MRKLRWFRWAELTIVAPIFAVLALLGFQVARELTQPLPTTVISEPTSDALRRGEYLTRAGNCMHCHTERGGTPYAGGRAVETPFGSVYSSNITPDADTGIGRWTADDFWQAIHHGVSKDGRWLLPAFPYNNFTLIERSDSDAMYAFLRSVPAISQVNRVHALAWPFNSQWALGLWRAMFFRAQPFKADTLRSLMWNRGAYLVQGLGHCSACHAAHNALGASTDAALLGGGMIAVQNWYAPSLAATVGAVAPPWKIQETVQLLQTGTSSRGWASGPMADVVLHSTQYLTPTDLTAIAAYLKDLPPGPAVRPSATEQLAADPELSLTGGRLYQKHCAQCHAEDGQGVPGAYPALTGSTVNQASPVNLIQMVLHGGFAPATSANPRPFGMPPFALSLSDHEIAAVLTYIRSAWGNHVSEVTPLDVDRLRGHSR